MNSDGRKIALFGACLVHAVLIGGAFLSIPPLFDRISATEGWSLQQLQEAWAYLPLGSGAAALVSGALLQTRSDRSVLAAAALVAVLGMVWRGWATGPWTFGASLFVFGIGSGAAFVVLANRVTRLFDSGSAGMAQAAFFGAYTIGSATGLATAESLAAGLGGWRSVPLVWAALSAVSLVPALATTLAPDARTRIAPPGPGWWQRASRYAFSYGAYLGAYLGLVGLLPYQLREWGWDGTEADGVLALSTLGFMAGSFWWASVTDRLGHRRAVYAGCMAAMAALVLLVPSLAQRGSDAWTAAIITAMGFFSGALVLFFPIVSSDPRTGGELTARSVGFTSAASYVGGFAVPFSLAPIAENRPVLAITACAATFAACGGVMIFRQNAWPSPP
ncbi:MAG: MFS transporter [Myxococcota bacterium]